MSRWNATLERRSSEVPEMTLFMADRPIASV